MPLFRKKPVVIEAFQVTADLRPNQVPAWFKQALDEGSVLPAGETGQAVDIATLEGTMRANIGDWIIRGVEGELYPCRNDIFAATYEAVA